MTDWQPIETAPKDGTLFSVKGDPNSHDWATFHARFKAWPNGSSGWQTDDGCDLEPTHWMPLPDEPSI